MTIQPKTHRPRFSHKELLDVLHKLLRGYRISEIAISLGRSPSGVHRLLKRWGIPSHPADRDRAPIEKLIEQFTGGPSTTSLHEDDGDDDEVARYTCIQCSATFTMSRGEHDWFVAQPDLSLPKRCPQCRAARRAYKGNAGWGMGEAVPSVSEADRSLSEMSEKLLGAYASKIQVMEQQVADELTQEKTRLEGYNKQMGAIIDSVGEVIGNGMELVEMAEVLQTSLVQLQNTILRDYTLASPPPPLEFSEEEV